MKILVVAKQNEKCIKSADKLKKNLNHEVVFDPLTGKKLNKKSENIDKFDGDFVITLGGDGTFLWTAQHTDKPILPVRAEGFGYLCSIDFDKLINDVKIIEKHKITERTRLSVKCKNLNAPDATNEIVFTRQRPSKIINIKIIIDKTRFEFKGDSILFSTSVGSTAYASSVGGCVIDPNIDIINIVPISPFNSKIKPIVVPIDKKIYAEMDSGIIAIDGQWEKMFINGKFTIQKGKSLKLITFEDAFYRKLKEKLF